jgi:hypothetical protein
MSSAKLVTDDQLPGLYKASNGASLDAQRIYFFGLLSYLVLLTFAAWVSYKSSFSKTGTLLSALLFIVTLGILVGLRVKRPDETWYNGRAVAESVKTRSWRWMMCAEPYENDKGPEMASKAFISDLKEILSQNKNLAAALSTNTHLSLPISDRMKEVRAKPTPDRLAIYLSDRVQDQADWYGLKFIFNRKRATFWFGVSVALHLTAIIMLLLRVQNPSLNLPVEVIAVAATAVLTWLQAKKHNELASSYSLAAHEIMLIKGESGSVQTDPQLSDYVLSAEAAFSREHTQWVARRSE